MVSHFISDIILVMDHLLDCGPRIILAASFTNFYIVSMTYIGAVPERAMSFCTFYIIMLFANCFTNFMLADFVTCLNIPIPFLIYDASECFPDSKCSAHPSVSLTVILNMYFCDILSPHQPSVVLHFSPLTS